MDKEVFQSKKWIEVSSTDIKDPQNNNLFLETICTQVAIHHPCNLLVQWYKIIILNLRWIGHSLPRSNLRLLNDKCSTQTMFIQTNLMMWCEGIQHQICRVKKEEGILFRFKTNWTLKIWNKMLLKMQIWMRKLQKWDRCRPKLLASGYKTTLCLQLSKCWTILSSCIRLRCQCLLDILYQRAQSISTWWKPSPQTARPEKIWWRTSPLRTTPPTPLLPLKGFHTVILSPDRPTLTIKRYLVVLPPRLSNNSPVHNLSTLQETVRLWTVIPTHWNQNILRLAKPDQWIKHRAIIQRWNIPRKAQDWITIIIPMCLPQWLRLRQSITTCRTS